MKMKSFLKRIYYFSINHCIHLITCWILLYGCLTVLFSHNSNISWYSTIYLIVLTISLMLSLYIERYYPYFSPLTKIVHHLIITIALPILFLSTTEMIKSTRNVLFDKELTEIDSVFFPFFSYGQIGIEIDKHNLINPSTFHGKLLNDYFEILYISYYLWGYLSFGVCAIEVLKYWIYRLVHQRNFLFSNDERDDISIQTGILIQKEFDQKVLNMEYFIILLSTTFSLVFLLNLLVPGKSPRIYLSNEYKNEIEGFGFTSWWKRHVDRDDSSGTFPSGHCGETFAVAFGIYYSHKQLGIIVFIMSFLISISTLWNRYHYVIDLIVGIICSLIGYVIANLYIKQKKNI